ncbi:hypothetical protein [Actinocorallia sp. A-T 12471]|uniref:hypothetical protein n=1 Tax=Actinocorallia sp. A-T 12471 TaxID=3089813 RepID=UPI0029CC3B2C|nr:hypothetical protein [Actinocorallia sp. A-T 12471]MDX6744072.1 hypothetical protein [Actinocorallia sp. A-T 12471]
MSERTPRYLESDRLDDLARMIAELTSELWILKDRTLVLEHLLERHGVIAAAAVDGLAPSADLAARLRAEREALVSRVFGAVLDPDTRVTAAVAAAEKQER